MNPGGIRADIPAGTTTFGILFTVQPFGNSLVTMDLTGQQVIDVLEQQWSGGNATAPKVMKTSGIQYTWDASKPAGGRVVVGSVKVSGAAINLAGTYRVTCNSFMATGGDNFLTFNLGTNRVGGAVDLDALIAYVKSLAQPYSARSKDASAGSTEGGWTVRLVTRGEADRGDVIRRDRAGHGPRPA